jgi:hypothetical protein
MANRFASQIVSAAMVVPAPAGPPFEYVAAFGRGREQIRGLSLVGINTKHGAENTQRGRLWARVEAVPAGGFAFSVYNAGTFDPSALVATVTGADRQGWLDFTGGGLSGSVYLDYSADASLLIVPTFAVDRDVFLDPAAAAGMPGYDPANGLTAFHAEAVRQLMTIHLPARLPNLFGGSGLSAFAPGDPAAPPPTIPDLSKIANVDQLRSIQATLVKALAAEQSNHLREFAEMATAAYARADALLGELDLANTADATTPTPADPTYTVTTWNRV